MEVSIVSCLEQCICYSDPAPPVRMVMIQGSPLAVDTENDLKRANDLYEHMLEYPTPNADKEILNKLKEGE